MVWEVSVKVNQNWSAVGTITAATPREAAISIHRTTGRRNILIRPEYYNDKPVRYRFTRKH